MGLSNDEHISNLGLPVRLNFSRSNLQNFEVDCLENGTR